MANTGTFNCLDVLCSYSGIPLSGWADDVIKVEPVKGDKTIVQGPGGDIIAADTNSKLVKVTLSFLYGTPAVKALEAARLLNLGPAPLIVSDTRNTVLFAIPQCFITDPPAPELKGEPGALVYVLQGNVAIGFLA